MAAKGFKLKGFYLDLIFIILDQKKSDILDEIIEMICENQPSNFWKKVADKLFDKPCYSEYENDNEFIQMTCSQKLLRCLQGKFVTWEDLKNCLVKLKEKNLVEKCLNESLVTVGK